jgi:NAD-dependent DNA ligase
MPHIHSDHAAYFYLASKIRLTKSIQTLTGIIKGIAIDKEVGKEEIAFLLGWVKEHEALRNKHPFNELLPVIDDALEDGILTEDEKEDILWLSDKLASENGWVDKATTDIQQLHGVLAGIIADGVVTEGELAGLSEWIEEHEHLRTCWPYDEVDALITAVMRDGVIDEVEQKQLLSFFSEFIALEDDRTITSPLITEGALLTGVCAVCPEIQFPDFTFCVTGASNKYSRNEFNEVIQKLGGKTTNGVSKKVNYLVIGAEGNPCWMYSCYGRKVEQAVNLRKEGHRIVLIHENDFHDAVVDAVC